MKSKLLMIAAVATTALAGAAYAQDAAAPAAPPAASAAPAVTLAKPVAPAGDLVETMRANGQFTILIKALASVNLLDLLKNPNLTVFAPPDAAFNALPPGALDKLMADKASLQKVMLYHIINARVDSTKIKDKKGPVPSVEASPLTLNGTGPMLMIDNADIIQSDVMTSNGVLHVIDKVLTPADVPAAAALNGGTPTAALTNGRIQLAQNAVNDPQSLRQPADPNAERRAVTPGVQTPPADASAAGQAQSAESAAQDTSAVTNLSTHSPEDQAKMKAGEPNVVSNGPVPDTTQNRAEFGGPDSNGGQKTAPAGN